MNCVITRLNGGLGNQLFQYAAARCLADRLSVPLKLDLSEFDTYKLRDFELNKFNIEAEIANPSEIAGINIYPSRANRYCSRIAISLGYALTTIAFKEKTFCYDKLFEKITEPIYLNGYWQSEKYFKPSEERLRQELNLKFDTDNLNEFVLTEIRKYNAVSIHIRRGDYVSNPSAAAVHGICSLEYYEAAIQFIASRTDQPFFFVFSDDPQWAKNNLKTKHPTYFVEEDGTNKGAADMCLMSTCNHHIIANSSFSWWGAWLNNKADKIVVAPQIWFRDTTINTRDLLPAQWYEL